jgi:hypothetical protein
MISQHARYEANKQRLINLGIERMLKNKTSNNEELQQYLNEKAYETASLGETSADELAAVPQQTAEVDFFRESDINQKYKQG